MKRTVDGMIGSVTDEAELEADHEQTATGRLYLLFDYFRNQAPGGEPLGRVWAQRYGLTLDNGQMPELFELIANDVRLPRAAERELLPIRAMFPRNRIVEAVREAEQALSNVQVLSQAPASSMQVFTEGSLRTLEDASHLLWVRNGQHHGADGRADLETSLNDFEHAIIDADDLTPDQQRVLLVHVEEIRRALKHWAAVGPDGPVSAYDALLGHLARDRTLLADVAKKPARKNLFVRVGAAVAIISATTHGTRVFIDDSSDIVDKVIHVVHELESGSITKPTDPKP